MFASLHYCILKRTGSTIASHNFYINCPCLSVNFTRTLRKSSDILSLYTIGDVTNRSARSEWPNSCFYPFSSVFKEKCWHCNFCTCTCDTLVYNTWKLGFTDYWPIKVAPLRNSWARIVTRKNKICWPVTRRQQELTGNLSPRESLMPCTQPQLIESRSHARNANELAHICALFNEVVWAKCL